MKLLINIPDEKYNQIKEWEDDVTDYQTTLMLYRTVRGGRPITELLQEIKSEQRPQGEWIKKVDDVGFISYICSQCGFELELEDCSDSYYCTNCGADMRGEE